MGRSSCGGVAIDFAQAQIDAGADIIGLGDALASQISPAMYREFALPYDQANFTPVHEKAAVGRLHICGDTNKILGDMVAGGADIIDLDWMLDMASAGKLYGGLSLFLWQFQSCRYNTSRNAQAV